jgi:hypothetical protein
MSVVSLDSASRATDISASLSSSALSSTSASSSYPSQPVLPNDLLASKAPLLPSPPLAFSPSSLPAQQNELPRAAYKSPHLIQALQDVLDHHRPPPNPIKLTSPRYTMYTVRLTSKQSKVILWLFAHPSLHLEQVKVDDGWTTTNKRSHAVLDALFGVKVDKRWITELIEYWKELPKVAKQKLMERYNDLVDPADPRDRDGDVQEEKEIKDDGIDGGSQPTVRPLAGARRRTKARRKKRRRVTVDVSDSDDMSQSDSSVISFSAADVSSSRSHPTVTSTKYARLNELYGEVASATRSLEEYKRIAFELQLQQEEYEQHEVQMQQAKQALKQEQAEWKATANQEKLSAEEQLRVQRELLQREREQAEQTRLQLTRYALHGALGQPAVVLEAVRQLVATAGDDKSTTRMLHQMHELLAPFGTTQSPEAEQKVASSATVQPSASPPPASYQPLSWSSPFATVDNRKQREGLYSPTAAASTQPAPSSAKCGMEDEDNQEDRHPPSIARMAGITGSSESSTTPRSSLSANSSSSADLKPAQEMTHSMVQERGSASVAASSGAADEMEMFVSRADRAGKKRQTAEQYGSGSVNGLIDRAGDRDITQEAEGELRGSRDAQQRVASSSPPSSPSPSSSAAETTAPIRHLSRPRGRPKLYCVCHQPCKSDEEYVACANNQDFDDNEPKLNQCVDKKAHGWFHLGCAGLTRVPEGSWLCDACRKHGFVLSDEGSSRGGSSKKGQE